MKKWIPLTLGLTLAMAGSAYAQTTTSTTTTKKVVALNSTTKPHYNQGNKRESFGLKLDQSAALLTLLNTDEAKLQKQLEAGKSLADVAAAEGIDKQKVIDLLVSQETTRLDAAQTAGSLTADQVTKKKLELTARITKLVERQGIAEERGGHGPGEGKGHGGGWLNNSEELATLLGLTTDKLQEAVKSGKSLATIAKEQSIDVQKVIDLQVIAMTKQLDQQLADGKIEQADYTTRKAQLTERAAKIVNGKLGGKGDFKGGPGGRDGGNRGNFTKPDSTTTTTPTE